VLHKSDVHDERIALALADTSTPPGSYVEQSPESLPPETVDIDPDHLLTQQYAAIFKILGRYDSAQQTLNVN
jgi:hypothetical protein